MGGIVGWFLALFLLILLIGKGDGDDESYDADANRALSSAEPDFDSSRLPASDEGSAIAAPSDPGASYRILQINRMENGSLEVVSRRDGPSGTNFARREINCDDYTYRYLGEGDTREQAEADAPNIGNMSGLTGSSASSDVANAACSDQL